MPRTRKDRVDWPSLTEGAPNEWFPVAVFDIGMLTERNWKTNFDYEPLAELVPRKRPAIISASVMVLDFSVGDVMGEEIIVCPPWFDDALKEQAAAHFGLSVDDYLARSCSTDEALGVLAEHFDVARVIASHNLGTDLKQIRLDAMRVGRDFYAHEDKHLFCTMLNGAEVTDAMVHRGVKKWPKLPELYEKLWRFECPQDVPHQSWQDAEHCAACYCGLWMRHNEVNPADLDGPFGASMGLLKMINRD